MKIKKPRQVYLVDVDAYKLQTVPLLRPSFVVWMLHWVSTLLVLFLLATSLASGLGFTKRPFPAVWMDWHLSTGVALLALTAIRMKTSHPWNGLTRAFASGRLYALAIKPSLFFAVVLVVLSGLAIFQKPPFGRAGTLFGLVPMPTLIQLNHYLHNVIIDLHIVLSFIVLALIIAHFVTGVRRIPEVGQSRLAVMLWPWRRNQSSRAGQV